MTERTRPEIIRRIEGAVAKAIGVGLEPRSVYLTPDDREQLLAALKASGEWWEGEPEPEILGGLQLRRISGRGRSKVYCRHGIARELPARPPP